MFWIQFIQDAEADLRANYFPNPFVLFACCVNIPTGMFLTCKRFCELRVLCKFRPKLLTVRLGAHQVLELLNLVCAGCRVLPLQQEAVSAVVRADALGEVWTGARALEYLLLCGLVPEAVWFAHALGDWKAAFILSVICQRHSAGYVVTGYKTSFANSCVYCGSAMSSDLNNIQNAMCNAGMAPRPIQALA